MGLMQVFNNSLVDLERVICIFNVMFLVMEENKSFVICIKMVIIGYSCIKLIKLVLEI